VSPIRRLVPALGLIVALVASGCDATLSTADGGKPAPALDTVKTLADPREAQGPSTAVIANTAVRPIVANPKPKLPVTLTDAQGTNVTVKDTSRILALDIYGTLARTVFELGLGDHLVGRDISTQFKEASELPLVTHNGHELNAESILKLNPSVILTDSTLGPWDVVLQMRDSGVPVVITDSKRNLTNVGTITNQVATALGVPAAGKKLTVRTEQRIAEVKRQIAAVAPTSNRTKLRAVFIYARGSSGIYYLFGEGSGADSLITSLGLYDVAKEIDWKGSKPLTDEGIVAAQPDLILMMTKGLESVNGPDGLFKRFPALASTPAGQHERIVDMADSEILGYGPLTDQVLNALAVAIYAPDAVR